MRLARTLGVAALALVASSCAAFAWPDAIATKIADDRARLHAYEGTIAETGLVPGDPSAVVRSRVRFRAPGSVVVEVLEPAAYAGDVLARVGSDVFLYSNRLEAGVRMRNVPATGEAQVRALVQETTRFDLDAYGYREGDPARVAGRAATTWTVTPRAPSGLGGVSRWWMDADLSIPLRVEIDRADEPGTLYSLRFDQIRVFEPTHDEPPLAWQPPERASWLEWDLAGASLSRDEARAAADFPLLETREPPEGLALARVLRASPRVVPVLALLYERPPFYASVSEQKDRGLSDAKALGVPVDLGGATGRIAFAGDTCTVHLVRDGVDATVLTNLPPALAVRFARSLEAAKR